MDYNRLYEKAFQYRNAKKNGLNGVGDLFGLRLDGKTTGYVLFRGLMRDDDDALALLPDEEALFGFLRLLECWYDLRDDIEADHLLATQDVVECAFSDKDALNPAAQKAVRAFARANGIRLAGRNAYPDFTRFRPGRVPWGLTGGRDIACLALALDAAAWLAEQGMLLPPLPEDRAAIRILTPERDGYSVTVSDFPVVPEVEYPQGSACNDVTRARVLQLPKRGFWGCEVVRVMAPVAWEGDEVPVVPAMLLVADLGTEEQIPVRPVADYETRTEVMLNMFMDAMLETGSRPARLAVVDDRTETLLSDWCKTLGIRLVRQESCPGLEAVADMLRGPEDSELMDETSQMVDELLELTRRPVEELPGEMSDMAGLFGSFGQLDGLPEELQEKFRLLEQRLTGGETGGGNIIQMEDIRRQSRGEGKRRRPDHPDGE